MSKLPKKYRDEPCSKCGASQTVVDGAWLRALRIVAGYSLRAVAAKLNFSAPYLSDVERGRRAALPHIVKGYEAL